MCECSSVACIRVAREQIFFTCHFSFWFPKILCKLKKFPQILATLLVKPILSNWNHQDARPKEAFALMALSPPYVNFKAIEFKQYVQCHSSLVYAACTIFIFLFKPFYANWTIPEHHKTSIVLCWWVQAHIMQVAGSNFD